MTTTVCAVGVESVCGSRAPTELESESDNVDDSTCVCVSPELIPEMVCLRLITLLHRAMIARECVASSL